MNAFTIIGYISVAAVCAYLLVKFIGLVRDVGWRVALLSPVWMFAMLFRRR